jgi:hypothetical protein
MHAIPSIRLFRSATTRKVAALVQRRFTMNTTSRFAPRFELLDDLLFLVALFVPVSLLLAGSFALAATGSI